jgi:hypothetical protein
MTPTRPHLRGWGVIPRGLAVGSRAYFHVVWGGVFGGMLKKPHIIRTIMCQKNKWYRIVLLISTNLKNTDLDCLLKNAIYRSS